MKTMVFNAVKWLALGCGLLAGVSASAQMLSEKVYVTGAPLEKPLLFRTFSEFRSARKVDNLTFQSLQGESQSLSQFSGNLVILNLWATWCAPCLREIPALTTLQKQLDSSKIRIVGVSVDEKGTDIKSFLKKHHFEEFLTWVDEKKESQKVMPLTMVPVNYIFDGQGNLVGFIRGYLPWEDKEVIPFLEKLAQKYADPVAQNG